MVTTHTEREYTLADLDAFPDDGVKREIRQGALIEHMNPPQMPHSVVRRRLGGALGDYADNLPNGDYVGTEAGVILPGEKLTLYSADVCYASIGRVIEYEATKYIVLPELAVEVVSEYDRQKEVVQKKDDYLQAGVMVVWVVYPDSKTVVIFKRDHDPVPVGMDGILEDQGLLPGFRYSVRKLFQGM